MSEVPNIVRLVRATPAAAGAERALGALAIDATLLGEDGDTVSRAVFAMALNVVLFADLLGRVPSGAKYVAERVGAGGRVRFDHGALRTIRFAEGPTGALPPGEAAFRRIVEPLGYRLAGVYPLPALKMTGRAYAHIDCPESIPQFFLSELHVERFGGGIAEAARRVFGGSRDPLDGPTLTLLDDYAAERPVAFADAARALPVIAAAFGRQHDVPALSDYEILLGESGEAAWIATEGNAFNHATDRVDDVDALAARLRADGWPIKDKVEVSANGRVRQTALRADIAKRPFRDADGGIVMRSVPGSFYEFISRAVDPEAGGIDLGFDSGNATGIFAMTKAS